MIKHSQALVRRAVIATTAIALGLFAVVLSAQPAGATVQGGCIATINHITASQAFTSDNAIEVFEHSSVDVFMQMNAPVHRRLTYLSFGVGPSALVGDETDPANSTTTINVDKYATYGVGLYRVDATATSVTGQSCRVSALVKVDGNPETTVAGGAATGAEVLALLGLAGAGVRGANPGEAGTGSGDEADQPLDEGGMPKNPLEADTVGQAIDRTMQASAFGFCALAALPALLLTAAAMAGGAAPTGGPIRVQRVHWRPRFSVVGMGSGVVGGLAAVVLLQQTGRLFPSYEILGRALVAGLLAGILIPSLARVIAVRRANRRVAARELALNAAVRRSAAGAGATTPPVAAPPPGGAPAPTWVGTHRVTQAGAPVRSDPSDAAGQTSELAAGTALRIVEERGSWARVQSADGREGWVNTGNLERMT
jgi:hypothetical protein